MNVCGARRWWWASIPSVSITPCSSLSPVFPCRSCPASICCNACRNACTTAYRWTMWRRPPLTRARAPTACRPCAGGRRGAWRRSPPTAARMWTSPAGSIFSDGKTATYSSATRPDSGCACRWISGAEARTTPVRTCCPCELFVWGKGTPSLTRLLVCLVTSNLPNEERVNNLLEHNT